MMKNVPKLRFRGFDGEWEETTFKDVFNCFEYGMNSAAVEFDGINKYIRITDIDETSNKYIKDNVVSPDGNLEEKYLVKENDILFARTGASVGKTYLYDKNDGKLYFAGFLIRGNVSDKNNSRFIFMETLTESYRKWVKVVSMRSGQPGINSQEYSSYVIKVPSLQEQQRIADFLTKVDKLIEKQDEKVKNLELYKKGMMQKIFSQKIRFRGKNGEEFPEWEEKKLGDFLTFYNTNSYSRDCLNDNYGNVKNIHYGDIHMKFSTIVDVTNTHIPYINEDIDISKIPEESFCKDGDIVIADASEDYDDIGKTIELKNIGNERIVAGLHTILARDTKNVIYNGYAGYMFLDEKVRKQIKILAAGAKVLGISKNNIVKVTVKLPSREEQRKIVDFLYRIDCLVEKEKSKLESLTKWKKGLLQKMFV